VRTVRRSAHGVVFQVQSFPYNFSGAQMTVSTTQAKADTATATEGSVATINVLSNDVGKSLALYSVAQSGAAAVTTATTANGATIKIVNGKITYDTTTSATISALAEGQILTDTFTYSVRGSDGVVSTSTVTIKVTGDNDKPVLALDASGPHTMIESASGAAVTATGVLAFTDIDRADTHTASDVLVSAVWSGGAISSESRAAIAAALTATVAQDSTNGATGSVALNFSLADSVVSGLGAGETLTMTYSVSVSDGKGGVSSQPVTFTVTGTNDAPSIEAASVANLCLISGATAFGTVAFADDDINDKHTAVTKLAVYHSTGVLTAAQQTDLSKALLTTVLDDAHGYGFGDDGIVGWGFKLPASLARLATGQSVLAQYEMTVSDGKGGTAVQPISVLVVGGPNGSMVYAGVTGADLIETANTGSPVIDHAEGSLAIPDLLGWTIHSVTSNLAYSDWSGGALSTSAKASLQAALTTHAETGPGFWFLSADSKIVWDFDLPASATDFLGAGETLTLAYQVTVTGLFGLKTTELVTITLTGTNDAPVLVADATPVHAITELANLSGGTAANAASGVLTFTDADRNGAHTVSVGSANAVWSAGAAPAATSAALASALTTQLTENGAGAGQVAFTFSLANGLVDFLATGETYKVTYLVTVTDAQGASSTQPVVFTLTGTNDKPVLAVDSVATHSLIETAGQSGQAAVLTSTGSLTFTDPDLTNTHTVSIGAPGVVWSGGAVAPAATSAALASALSATLTETQGSGTVAFALAIADGKLDFLAAGETLKVVYLLTVTDSSGAVSSQPVTFVFTGTNDVPTLTGAHASGATVEDGVLTAAAT
jgi:VCBS repeat-containing protein